jgi:hypothetical protein
MEILIRFCGAPPLFHKKKAAGEPAVRLAVDRNISFSLLQF